MSIRSFSNILRILDKKDTHRNLTSLNNSHFKKTYTKTELAEIIRGLYSVQEVLQVVEEHIKDLRRLAKFAEVTLQGQTEEELRSELWDFQIQKKD